MESFKLVLQLQAAGQIPIPCHHPLDRVRTVSCRFSLSATTPSPCAVAHSPMWKSKDATGSQDPTGSTLLEGGGEERLMPNGVLLDARVATQADRV